MRKITASFFMSLDGVVDAPHEWHFPYMDQEAQAASGAALATTDTILLGRATYEEWLPFWPTQGTSNPMAAFFNTTPKLVVSTTLHTLDWEGSTLVDGDVSATLRQVKEQPGQEIAIFGSGTLVRSLLLDGLIDELRLLVHPVVIGRGRHLFEDGDQPCGLELLESTTLSSGMLNLVYGPAR